MKIRFRNTWVFEKIIGGIFLLHLAGLLILSAVDYIDPLGPFHGEPVTFTLRGTVSVTPEIWKPFISRKDFHRTEFHAIDTVGVRPSMLTNGGGFVRIDYTDIPKGLSGPNLFILISELAFMWIWLYVSWALWRIARDIRTGNVFAPLNIRRLQKIAFVFPAGAFLHNLHGRLFAQLVRDMFDHPGYRIFFPQSRSPWNLLLNTNMFASMLVMLVILLIIQILVQGSKLKEENDLTV